MQKILSVIIPYYNAKEYTDELLSILDKQITDEIEVLLIDDGSKEKYVSKYSWLNIIRQNNGGASAARNTGLDNAIGQYISFIDADDLVTDNYFEIILQKIKEEKFDYMYLSWDSFGGWDTQTILHSIEDEFPSWNLCVWNRIYKREVIKDIRFNLKKLIAEDAEFIRKVQYNCKKKSYTDKILYHYRSNTPNSLTKRFGNNELNMERIIYNFKHINSKMTYLIDEAKKFDEYAEVIFMTEKNDIPELSKYAMVIKPTEVKGTRLYGEPTKLFHKIYLPIKTQIVIWTKKTFEIGGIETFIYSFVYNLKDKYDITVLYDEMHEAQIEKLRPYANVVKNNIKQEIYCDSLIINRITDKIPNNIKYKQKIQMVHCCKLVDNWKVPTDNDIIIPVSQIVKNSFEDNINGNDFEIINNLMYPIKTKKVLRLVSGTRLTFEKGAERIIALAKEFQKQNIPFIWTIFTDGKLKENIEGIICLKPTQNLKNYIAASDYLVQLSDSEAFCYSIVESLEIGTPVITTPLPILKDIGVKDGENGFIVPFDMKNISSIVRDIYEKELHFTYHYDNYNIVKQWKKILDKKLTPLTKDKKTQVVDLIVLKSFYDVQAEVDRKKGEIFSATPNRAKQITDIGFAKILTT